MLVCNSVNGIDLQFEEMLCCPLRVIRDWYTEATIPTQSTSNANKHNNRLHTVHQLFHLAILCCMQNPYKSLEEFLQLPT